MLVLAGMRIDCIWHSGFISRETAQSTLILWMAAFWIGLFVSMKLLVAATGFRLFIPLLGRRNDHTGRYVCGHAQYVHTATLVSTHMVNHRLLAGWRVPTALPNIERVRWRDRQRQTDLIWIGCTPRRDHWRHLIRVWLCYTWGGASFHSWALEGSARERYNIIAGAVGDTDRSVPDTGKNQACTCWAPLGALIFAVLQARIPWWPIHPMGLMVMYSWYMRIYILDIFLSMAGQAAGACNSEGSCSTGGCARVVMG